MDDSGLLDELIPAVREQGPAIGVKRVAVGSAALHAWPRGVQVHTTIGRDSMGGRTRTFTERIIGASRLDARIYDEVEHDSDATVQAAGVVVLVAAATALAGVDRSAAAVIPAVAVSIIGWLLWAGITYLIGDKLLGGTATWGELLRTLGFAQAPGMLLMLMAVPTIGWVVQLVVGVWMLLAGVVAIRQALDFGTGRAIATALLGLLPYAALRVLVL